MKKLTSSPQAQGSKRRDWLRRNTIKPAFACGVSGSINRLKCSEESEPWRLNYRQRVRPSGQIATKADLLTPPQREQLEQIFEQNRHEQSSESPLTTYWVSCTSRAGMNELTEALRQWQQQRNAEASAIMPTTASALPTFATTPPLSRWMPPWTRRGRRRGDELVAAELRLALHELGLVAGDVYTDDILDSLFSRFCIGK